METPWPQRLLIVLAVLVAFGRLGLHEFTGWDDPATIHQNPSFNPVTLPKVAWYWTAWGERAPMGLYVPLTYTFWGMLAKIAYLQVPDPTGIRLNPYVYHSANVVVHVMTALVVFELLRRLMRSAWAACAGALLWGLHPVQVEPVGWASGTKDLLCGLFSMIALLEFVHFARGGGGSGGSQGGGIRALHYGLGTLALVAAMLSKPTGLVVPIMALAIDRWCLHRPLGHSLRGLAPWFVLMIPCILWTRSAQSTIGVPTVPAWVRPFIAGDALAFYLYKLVLPLRLAVDYGRRPTLVLEQGWLWVTWIVPAGVAVLLALWRRTAPTLVAAGVIFLAGVLPVLGFLPFQFQYYSTVADHYLYLSMLGPALAIAWALDRWPVRPLIVASSIVLLVLGGLSFSQGRHWLDDVTLFRHNLRVNPRSFVSHNNLAAALFQRGRLQGSAQLIAESERHFREAIRIFPDYPSGHDNLANLLVRTGRLEEAIHHINEVLRVSRDLPPALRPDLDRPHNDLGFYLMSRGRVDEAIEHFRAALNINPNNPQAQENLKTALRLSAPSATRPATTTPATQHAP